MSKTKNQIAWEKLFLKYKILEEVKQNGHYYIDSRKINEFREARLMTKFDHRNNLPQIYQDNKLGILPVSRGGYIISNIELFEDKQDIADIIIKKNFPERIKSINYDKITSESIAISCSYLSGILEDFAGEELEPTISGRMKSDAFGFQIKNTVKPEMLKIEVSNSQIEIDGGYEGKENLVLIEAKNNLSDTFLIRQLYYPYRLWKDKISKSIKNVFMEYSNGIFNLYEYNFQNVNDYNSIILVKSRRYQITTGKILRDDIEEILKETEIVPEPEIPFPQADNFERIINLLELTYDNNEISKNEITENYDFDQRKTNYYTDAARYLGFLFKINVNGDITFCLTEEGNLLFKNNLIDRQKLLIKAICEHEVFKLCLKIAISSNSLNNHIIVEQMRKCRLFRIERESTYYRRASTIRKWINWCLKVIS